MPGRAAGSKLAPTRHRPCQLQAACLWCLLPVGFRRRPSGLCQSLRCCRLRRRFARLISLSGPGRRRPCSAQSLPRRKESDLRTGNFSANQTYSVGCPFAFRRALGVASRSAVVPMQAACGRMFYTHGPCVCYVHTARTRRAVSCLDSRVGDALEALLQLSA